MIVWNSIKFINKKNIDFSKDILTSKLICVPAAPALAENMNNEYYYNSLRLSNFCIIDSSLFAILCRLKGNRIYKYSGYQLIKDFLNYISNQELKVFLVNPNEQSSKNIEEFLIHNTQLKKRNIKNYIAPMYPKDENIEDVKLLNEVQKLSPDIIVINIAGGKQEVLGAYLKKNLNVNTTIICTGAAISFFTGDQAPIPNWADRMHLGWLFRIMFNPKLYFKRYFNAFLFIPYFFKFQLRK